MIQGLSWLNPEALHEWIESALISGEGELAGGYQGKVLLYQHEQHKVIVKVPPRKGILRRFYVAMLRHEYKVYRHLGEFEGIPKCYGLLNDCYLLLECIDGIALREVQPDNRTRFFNTMLTLLQRLHACDVAHFDLKKKDNILIVNGDQPCLVDFGAAVIRSERWNPLNHYMFRLGRKFDLNAWVKHKYRKDYRSVSAEDRVYLQRTWIETVAHEIKYLYKRIKRFRRRLGGAK